MDDGTTQISSELLAAIRAGDEAASRLLVDRLYPLVISIVRNHLPRTEAEEDLSQEIYMKLFSRLHQYSHRQPFEHWVSRIALNTCYDRLRRQRTRRLVTFNELGTEEAAFLETSLRAPRTAPSEGGHQLGRELLDKLFTALKPREQMVVRLLDLEEKTVAEVCSITGWGASRVRVTAMRARRKLSNTLERLEQSSSSPN